MVFLTADMKLKIPFVHLKSSPSRIILLTEEKAPEEKTRAEKMITDTFGSVLKVEKKYTTVYDVVKVGISKGMAYSHLRELKAMGLQRTGLLRQSPCF